MAISLDSLTRGIEKLPPRLIIYGPRGVGKSTFASKMPNPIFVQTEDGSSTIDTTRTPLIIDLPSFFDWLKTLYNEEHNFNTLVIDTLDWTEKIVHELVRTEKGPDIFTDYGKGYVYALAHLEKMIPIFNALRSKKKMAIVLLAHSQIKRFEAPDTQPYDRYQLDLHQKAAAVFEEWADAILFANYRVSTKEEKGSRTTRTRGIGNGERVLYTEERPAFHAKNRYSLPPELEFSWAAVSDGIQKKLA